MYWTNFLLKCKSYEKLRSWTITKNVIIKLSMEPWISTYLFPHLIIENYGILKASVFKNQLTILTGLGIFKIKIATHNAKSYRKHYWIYFVTSFPIKLNNFVIKWMTGLINWLKTNQINKNCHMNPTVGNKEALDIQSQECTSLINESKDRYIAKISAKSKRYWSIINKFLSNKKIPSYHLFLIKVN